MIKIIALIGWFALWFLACYFVERNISFFIKHISIALLIGCILGVINLRIWMMD